MPELLTVKDLCKLFKVVEKTIYRWIEEKKFPHAFKVGKGHYVPASDVRRLKKKLSDPDASTAPAVPRSPTSGFVNRWRT